MIPWQTIVDADHGLHEYKAHVASIDFYIWRAMGRRFGISARRRLPNGNSEQLTHSGDIEWYDRSARRVRNASCTIIKLGFTDNDK